MFISQLVLHMHTVCKNHCPGCYLKMPGNRDSMNISAMMTLDQILADGHEIGELNILINHVDTDTLAETYPLIAQYAKMPNIKKTTILTPPELTHIVSVLTIKNIDEIYISMDSSKISEDASEIFKTIMQLKAFVTYDLPPIFMNICPLNNLDKEAKTLSFISGLLESIPNLFNGIYLVVPKQIHTKTFPEKFIQFTKLAIEMLPLSPDKIIIDSCMNSCKAGMWLTINDDGTIGFCPVLGDKISFKYENNLEEQLFQFKLNKIIVYKPSQK